MRSITKWAVGTIVSGSLLAAQPAEAQQIKGGFSLSSAAVSEDLVDPYTSAQRPGFIGGISFLAPIHDRAGVQVEALIHQQGAHELFRVDDRLRTLYLDVPVLAHVEVATFNRGAWYVIGGPTFGFNLQASYEDDGQTEDVKDDIRNVDVGLTAGGGVEVGRVSIEARYTWGVLNLLIDSESTLRNRSFAVMAGFKF